MIEEMARAAAAVPLSEVQQRIRSEIEMHREVQEARRQKGGPDEQPEIDRELSMIEGALQGLQQRVGGMVAALQTVVPDEVLAALLDPQRGNVNVRRDDTFRVETAVGMRLRSIQARIGECEDVLGTLLSGVRL